MKTGYIYAGIVVVVLFVGGAIIRKNITGHTVSPTPEPTLSVSAQVTPTPSTTTKPVKSGVKSTPGIIATEVKSYSDWVKLLDSQNRYLALDKDCSSIVPSQVEYPNNVQIMLDNTASEKSRILKIGGHDFFLGAHEWMLTTLFTSGRLPAHLTMFCEGIELGQLHLVTQ